MCTMTWLDRPDGGYDVLFNRDERRTRLPARPPAERTEGGTRFVAPLDGDFGGTWLAVNEHGLVVALLNGPSDAGPEAPAVPWTSRGHLVTALASSRSTVEAARRLDGVDRSRYRPFVLVLLDRGRDRRVASWSAGALTVEPDADRLLPIVSSSFDSAEVVRGRRVRFRELLDAASDAEPLSVHLAYHADHAPERGPRSVCMHRPDAETVSFSRIEVAPREIRFHYTAASPCRGLEPTTSVLAAGSGQ